MTASPDGPWPGDQHLPEHVRHIAGALALLPPVQDVYSEALTVGPYLVLGGPLWGNRLLPNSGAAEVAAGRLGLETRFCQLSRAPCTAWRQQSATRGRPLLGRQLRCQLTSALPPITQWPSLCHALAGASQFPTWQSGCASCRCAGQPAYN